MKSTSVLSVIVLVSAASLHAAWPQWRGVHRNGVAPESPALTTEFSDDGPKLVWESIEIPSDDEGGHSSVVVAGGRAYLSLVWHRDVPAQQRIIDTRVLRKLGHRNTKLEPEKIAAMEKARLSLSPRLRGGKLDEWIAQWIAEHLTEKEKLHYESFVKSRFRQGRHALPLDVLEAAADKKDEVFPDHASLVKWAKSHGWSEEIAEKVIDAVPATRQVAHDTVLCLDARTGKEVWRFEAETPPVNRAAASTPCVVEGKLFTALGGHAYCIDVKTGKPLWRTATSTKGPAASPLVVEGKLILLDQTLKALDAKTGELLWEQKAVKGCKSSPAAWGEGEHLTILSQSNGEFIGVNANTGEIRWQEQGGGDASAAISGDYLAIQHQRSNSGLVVYKISKDGIEKAWEHLFESRRYASSPILHAGRVHLLGGSRHLSADLDTGKILWNKPSKCEIASPILADGKLFITENNGGILTILDANADEYTELASTKVRAMRCPSPAIDGGFLYLRREKSICCFDLRKN